VVGVARSEKSDDAFREELAAAMPEELRAAFATLAPRVFYVQGDVQQPADLARLKRRLEELPGGAESGRLYYLSLKPDLFATAAAALRDAGLLDPAGPREPFRRVIIEKPFGHDLASGRALNHDLHVAMREDQIFRIDHYLGKETVQNLLGFRFHNAIFEPIWNRHHVEHIQITVAEELGMESGRAGYYDSTGALRDMLQNHMLQVLALVAMEPPTSLDAFALRSQKVNLLRSLHVPGTAGALRHSLRARYTAGEVGGKRCRGTSRRRGCRRTRRPRPSWRSGRRSTIGGGRGCRSSCATGSACRRSSPR
jgi:glucose-6-phosphate 1-dehydrogenase